MTENHNKTPENTGIETVLTHAGRDPDDQFGFVNTPVYRGSTVLFKTLADLDSQTQKYLYGRAGNPTTQGVESVVTTLEGAHRTQLVSSGVAAITVALMSCVKTGDDILISDSAYEPTRAFADGYLKKMGVTARYFDPRLGAKIEDLFQPNTRAVFVESPGSLTFEMQDLPAIAEVAHARGARVIVDNTWATPLFHQPLKLGADLVVHSATKMFCGHSDTFGGTISATEEAWGDVEQTRRLHGHFTSGDDAYLLSRGLKTLAIRMREHEQRALEIARWLEQQAEVAYVLHPALESHPDHAIWKRDFTGSGSLFAFALPEAPRSALAEFVDHMRIFSMGYSWGGYESLCLPSKLGKNRTAVPWSDPSHLVRLHIGFEDIEDLKADLSEALTRFAKAR